jgi:hypothetical protein
MNRAIPRASAVLLLTMLGAFPVISDEAEQRLASLAWLEGEWRGEFSGGSWEARYTGAEGGLILSTNKHVVDGQLRSWEYEQFRVEDGAVIMQPYPGGEKSPVIFSLTECDAASRRVVLENPAHDFPQILTYHRRDDETLHILVQSRREDERVGFELVLKRVR